ncbi:MAG: phosphoadenosine phosphosulfate reductase family protein [Pseudomonadales bacterium]|nr:phosphoadenosine phosphosulfate reductase family protein [Pseudomonadales bacterium]
MQLGQLDLEQINKELRDKSPQAILKWALSLNVSSILTTSFGFNSAVSLHMLANIDASVPVVWVDSGYNAKDAYVVAEQLMQDLQLNMHIYNPLQSVERRAAILGVPGADEPEFEVFTEQVKLEPFKRALDELKPQIWISGIRREETEHRKSLDIVSLDNRGILKVAPIFYWSKADVEAYMSEHKLPNCKHYFDPTKVAEHAECGLHVLPA